jgi:intracellular multiplication protein IcmG
VQNQQALKWNEKSNVVVTYVLRAVIPGRAWIERPLGGVLTIMEGEYVPGLGKVTRIDADNGEVTLDTGDVIKYGTDDH